jgi:hypothetical protein
MYFGQPSSSRFWLKTQHFILLDGGNTANFRNTVFLIKIKMRLQKISDLHVILIIHHCHKMAKIIIWLPDFQTDSTPDNQYVFLHGNKIIWLVTYVSSETMNISRIFVINCCLISYYSYLNLTKRENLK